MIRKETVHLKLFYLLCNFPNIYPLDIFVPFNHREGKKKSSSLSHNPLGCTQVYSVIYVEHIAMYTMHPILEYSIEWFSRYCRTMYNS